MAFGLALGALDEATLGELAKLARSEEITVPLRSSAIESAAYNVSTQLMTLNMADGTVLEYPSTPPQTFSGLISAPSPGGYYNRFIRGS